MYTLMETIYNIKNLFVDSCNRGKSTVSSLSALVSFIKAESFVDLSVFNDPNKVVSFNENDHWNGEMAEAILEFLGLKDSLSLIWDTNDGHALTGSFPIGTISMVKGEFSYVGYCPNLIFEFKPYQYGADISDYSLIDVNPNDSTDRKVVMSGHLRKISDSLMSGIVNLSPFSDHSGNVFSWFDVLTGLNQNLSICTVFETVAELMATGSLTISNFTEAVKGKITGLKDQAFTVYRQIISAIPQGVRSVIEVVKDWIHVISESTATGQSWEFSEKKYSTNGMCWGAVLSVAATVIQIVGMIVLAFSRVAGIIVTVLGTILKGVIDFFNNKINSTTQASIDKDSCNNNFATAILQQTFTSSEIDTWRADFFSTLMPRLKEVGFLKVITAGLEGWIWFVDDDTIKMELFPSARFKVDASYSGFYEYGAAAPAQYARHKMWRTNYEYGVSTEVLMQSNSNPIDVDTFNQMDKDFTTSQLLQRGYASAFWAATCLDLGYYYYIDPQGVPGSDEDRACYALLKFVAEQMANSYNEVIPNGKWEELTDYNTATSGVAGAMIAIFSNNYGNATKNLCGHIVNMLNTSFPDSQVPGSEDCVYPIFCTPARGVDAFYPPQYTQWALKSSIIASTVIIAITTAAAVATVVAWKRFSSIKAASISRDTEAAWDQYKRTGSKDDLKKYRSCCLKQNTLGRLVGCSAVSNSNFWAASSCDSSGSASNITDSLSALANPVSASDDYLPIDPSLNDLIILIKGSL